MPKQKNYPLYLYISKKSSTFAPKKRKNKVYE